MIALLEKSKMQNGITIYHTASGLSGDFRPRRGHPPPCTRAREKGSRETVLTKPLVLIGPVHRRIP